MDAECVCQAVEKIISHNFSFDLFDRETQNRWIADPNPLLFLHILLT